MRYRKASASKGTLDVRVRFSHETLILAAMALTGLWLLISLVQAVALNQSLGRQASNLRQSNAAMHATNENYRRDVAAVSSGAAAEEEARLNGYARADEKVYVIGQPQAQQPAARPTSQPAPEKGRETSPAAARGAQDGKKDGLTGDVIDWLWQRLTGLPPR